MESRSITLDDDEPRALQALLRYLYTLDCNRVFRHDDPLFSDVERDLDVFVIADKYNIQPLKNFMNYNLVLFYETDQRPPLDPKGWSTKNQTGFANVLMKLYRLDMDTTDIRKAMTNFIVRGGQKVMSWEGVPKAIEEDGRLSTDLIMAFFAAKRSADSRIKVLEGDVDDLEEQIAADLEEREELEGEITNLEYLIDSYDLEAVGDDDFPDPLYEYWDHSLAPEA